MHSYVSYFMHLRTKFWEQVSGTQKVKKSFEILRASEASSVLSSWKCPLGIGWGPGDTLRSWEVSREVCSHWVDPPLTLSR